MENVKFIKAGAEKIPLADRSIDVVFMFKSFHHIPIDLMGIALHEIKRILKADGIVYISEPIFDGDFNQVLRLYSR
ncbi:MAG: class I SAM-dependent methyltransferase [Pseudomonadota bacterium]